VTTREEMAEALLRWCSLIRVPPYSIGGNEPVVTICGGAASQLKRDGELRFRLANLCANARAIGHPQAAALARHVEALLKEFP